jgi:hypothetical protein
VSNVQYADVPSSLFCGINDPVGAGALPENQLTEPFVFLRYVALLRKALQAVNGMAEFSKPNRGFFRRSGMPKFIDRLQIP